MQDMTMGFSQTKTTWTPFLHAVRYENKGNTAEELPQMFSSPQPKKIKNREKKSSWK